MFSSLHGALGGENDVPLVIGAANPSARSREIGIDRHHQPRAAVIRRSVISSTPNIGVLLAIGNTPGSISASPCNAPFRRIARALQTAAVRKS